MDHSELIRALSAVAGPDSVSTSHPDRVAYAADMWPRAQIWKSGEEPARFPPDAVVWVGDRETLCGVLRVCNDRGVPVVPYGGGSGVCGGALPLRGGVVVDVKRMNRVLDLDRDSRLVTVEAGRLGQHLEDDMGEAGYTVGHFPSSIYCSTVGGYVAARSAGQYSSRYGTFEDVVRDLTVALPDGRLVRTGPRALGPDWTRIFLGNEGTLGFIVDATLRLHPTPEERVFRGFRMPTVEMGLVAMRRVMQAGLQPCVLRLYDPFDTVIAASEPPPEGVEGAGSTRIDRWLLEKLAPLRHDIERNAVQLLLARPALLNRLADRIPLGSLLVVGFEGTRRRVARQSAEAFRLLADAGGDDRGSGPGEAWYHHRYAVSFKQSKVFMAGAFVDTMEVSTTWARLPRLYRAVREAVTPLAFLMAHFSHAYREGCSIYFTFAGRLRGADEAAALHQKLWDRGLKAVVRAGASIAHHHGIGFSKRDFLADEYGPEGARAFQALKTTFDPGGVMNPGKLWPRPPRRDGRPAPVLSPPTGVDPVDPLSLTVRAGAGATWRDLDAALDRQGCRLPWWTAGEVGDDTTLGELLATPTALDWGPTLGGLAENLLAVDGLVGDRHRIRQTPAARRAAGPDLPLLLVGSEGRLGTLTSVVLRVAPRGAFPLRAVWSADAVAPLVEGLRRLLDDGHEVGRAALASGPEGRPRLALALAEDAGPAAAELAENLSLDDARPTLGAPWPVTLPATGYRDAVAVPWGRVAETLERAREDGLSVVAGRWEPHGAWLVAADAEDAERFLARAGASPPPPVDPDGRLVAALDATTGEREAR